MNNSIEQMQSIQQLLLGLSDSIEEMYCKMRKELMDEIIVDDKRNYAVQKNEMSNLYNKLSESHTMELRWIKNKLPWYITVFHKISSYEIFFEGTSIFIGVCFGNSHESSCYVEITPKDIGWK